MLVWAGSFIFIKIGLQEIKPYNLAFYRFILTSPVLLLAVYLKRNSHEFINTHEYIGYFHSSDVLFSW